MSVDQTLKERGSRYGDFSVHAEICQDFMRVMKRARNQNAWPDLNDVQRQALTVIADKIARILSGDPNYADNWHDIQGYARLVEERLPSPDTTCPDCGAPEGELHYVLCPRLPVPEAHAEAVEAAFAAEQPTHNAACDLLKPHYNGDGFPVARSCDCGVLAQAQFDEARADIIGQNGNEGEHYETELAGTQFRLDAGLPAVNVNDWRTWRVGDVLEAIVDYQECDGEPPVIREGELVTLLEVEPPAYDADLPVKVQAENGWYGWPDHEDYGEPSGAQRQLFRFHRRPAKTDE